MINVIVFAFLLVQVACKTTQEQESTAQSPKEDRVANTSSSMKAPITKPLPPMKLDKSAVDQLKLKSGDDSLFASIKRTPCYGRCPIYEAKIYNSGFVIYEGKRFVDKEGVFIARFSSDQLLEISQRAIELHFFKLNDEYDSPVTDFPTTYTSINNGKITKLVKNRVGGPDNLKELESFLDEMLNAVSWTKKSDVGSH
jgi:hypothetical protein